MFSFNSSQNALPNFSQALSGLARTTDQRSLSLFRRWCCRSPLEASGAIAAIRRRLLPRLADGESAKKVVAEEVAVAKFTLAKSHWKLTSEASSDTFFENNYGFRPEQLKTSATFLLTNATSSPQLQFSRGFKTKRSTDPRSLFRRGPSNDAKANDSKIDSSTTTAEDKTKAEPSGKGTAFWDKVNKLASVLVIVAVLVSLSQLFNISFRVVSRGGNEIAPEDIDVTFDDVKGCDEAKQELQEIVDFLMNPEKFSILGGKLPKGCLLVGPPGTGKTLLARAVAGQAGVPFFHAAGSEFDEILVGQGARRVRDLFKAAKRRAPCVVFIDEIDSVGAKRSSSVLHPYANQTINQLLSEMDGFVPNEGVIVLGATNRKEDLDRALLRPGRFDTQVVVPAPDKKGRKEILDLYLSKIKHDDTVDVEKLSKMTVGFTGADLENMVNTAAIRAATDGKEWVTMAEFEYSHDKHVLGTDWKSRVRDVEELRITAFHEAGHTIVAYYTKEATPLHKVTIVAKGVSGGHTAFLPEKDENLRTKSQLLAEVDVSMGGRAAEEIVFGKDKITSGASSDLQKATGISEAMVKQLGMSEKMGLRVVPDRDGLGQGKDLSPATYETIDSEVSKTLSDSYSRAVTILKTHRKELDLLAETLLNYETLDAEDVKAVMDGKPKVVAQKMASINGARSLKSKKGQLVGGGTATPPLNGGANGPDVLV